MSSVRYYVDEHVGSAVVHGLRQRGIEVMTVIDAGTIGRADEFHMAFALNVGRTIFTQDSDFLLAATGGAPCRNCLRAAADAYWQNRRRTFANPQGAIG